MSKAVKTVKRSSPSKSKVRSTRHTKIPANRMTEASKTNSSNLLCVSKKELKKRLKNAMRKADIEKLIFDYVQASLDPLPDMAVMGQLAQKHRAATLLNVSFRLESQQYDALAEYFKDDGQPGTYLVRKAIEEFIV